MNSDITQPDFGDRLRSLRLARGLSQRDLAGNGVSASYVSLLESGRRVPTPKVAAALADALSTGRSRLTGGALPDADDQEDQPPGRGLTDGGPDEGSDRSAVPDQDDELVRRVLSETAVITGQLSRAIAWAEASYGRERTSGQPAAIVESGLGLARLLGAAQCHERRAEVLAEVERTADEAGMPRIRCTILIDRASVARELGHLPLARSLVTAAAALLDAGPLSGTVEHVRMASVRAAVLCDLGEAGAARSTLPELLDVAGRLGEPSVLGRAEWVAALVMSRLADRAALDHLARARDTLDAAMPLSDWLRFCRAAATVVLDVGGDTLHARELLADGRSAQRAMPVGSERSALDVLEARIALADDDPGTACDLCRAVLDREHGLTGHDLLRLHRTYAEAAERLGRTATARDQLRETARTAEAQGLLAVALQAYKRLAEA